MENNENAGVQTETQTLNYEQMFKDLQGKYNSLNENYTKKSEAFDRVSSEVADYKRQQKENMTKEQQEAEEKKETLAKVQDLEAQIANYRLEKDILANGFTAEECDKLMKGNMSIGVFAEILKARLEENTKSVKASLIKGSTPDAPIGNGTAKDTETGFQKFQKNKQKNNNLIEL